jgi:hypothetical protein
MLRWWSEARRLRADGWTIKAISQKMGVTESKISIACKDIECPVNHQSLWRKRRNNKGRRRMLGFEDESVEDLPNG